MIRYIDFIVGDAVVSPPELQHGYVEKLLVMPYTFQVASLRHHRLYRRQQRHIVQVTSHADEHPHPWHGSRDEV
jgi:predicted O-linked N-acetylglucosamine transferase (SPINDLY family)